MNTKDLLDKIEKLEARIRELEARPAQPSIVHHHHYQPYPYYVWPQYPYVPAPYIPAPCLYPLTGYSINCSGSALGALAGQQMHNSVSYMGSDGSISTSINGAPFETFNG